MKRVISICLSVMLLLISSGCKSNEESKITGIYFDTAVTLSAYGEKVPSGALSLCEKYDKLFSATDKNSDIYKINHSSGNAVKVNPETEKIIKYALEYSALSSGAFDISVYPLKTAWGFYSGSPSLPKAGTIAEKLKYVGYKNIQLRDGFVTLPEGFGLDLGAIAKGYIADRLRELYEKENVAGIIDLGGNILTVGEKPDGENYKIGIKSPKNPSDIILTYETPGESVVTSGTYERKFTQGGKTYHHILDLKTGYPTDNGIASVTVMAESSAFADAFSTALLCMGKDDALKFANGNSQIECVIIMDDGQIFLSAGLKYTDKDYIIKK